MFGVRNNGLRSNTSMVRFAKKLVLQSFLKNAFDKATFIIKINIY